MVQIGNVLAGEIEMAQKFIENFCYKNESHSAIKLRLSMLISYAHFELKKNKQCQILTVQLYSKSDERIVRLFL